MAEKPKCGPECCTYYETCPTYKPMKYLKLQLKQIKQEIKDLKASRRAA